MQGSTLTNSSCSTTTTTKSSRRHKPLKAMRSRGGAGGAKQPEPTVEKKQPGTTVEVDCTVKIRDDMDGHLIYRKGDLVDQRCELELALPVGPIGPAYQLLALGLPEFIVPRV